MSEEIKMMADALPIASFHVMQVLGPPPDMRPQRPDESDVAYRFECLNAWNYRFVAMSRMGMKISLLTMEMEV